LFTGASKKVKDAILRKAAERSASKLALRDYKFILIPYNLNNKHWCLYIVGGINTDNKDLKAIAVIDSLPTLGMKHYKSHLNNIRKVLSESDQLPGLKFTETSHPMKQPVIPSQDNGYDCGLWVACWIKKIVNLNTSFDSMIDLLVTV